MYQVCLPENARLGERKEGSRSDVHVQYMRGTRREKRQEAWGAVLELCAFRHAWSSLHSFKEYTEQCCGTGSVIRDPVLF
jgi:hypothetical protein